MAIDNKLFPVLEQIAQAKTFSVKALIFDELRRGKIRLPDFQRPLRWGAKDNAMLFDSLVRGYPIGSILLWKRPAEAGRIKIGHGELHVDAVADARWVVDGQQRIIALAAAMLEIPDQSREYLVHFDPRKQEFFVPMHPAEHRRDEVPLTILGDLAKLNKWLRSQDLSEDLQDIVDKTHQRIVEYAVPAYEVDTPDEAPLRAVFARINSTGARMRADEVFHALLGKKSADREAVRLDALMEQARKSDFGDLERSEALKCVLAASGLNPTDRPENLGAEELKKLVSTDEVVDALGRALTFLQEDAGIPHLRLLPYPVALIILVRFFHLHSRVEAADRVRLARWLWRGAITGLHQRAEVSRMREALRRIQDNQSPSSNIDRLLERLRRETPVQWKLGHFDLRSAATRVELLTLLTRGPRRLPLLPGETDGGAAELHELLEGDRLAPEIYRLRTLNGEGTREKGKSAANRILIAGPWSGLATTLAKYDPVVHQALLESHLIDASMHDALRRGEADMFLSLREQALVAQVRSFLEERAGYGEPMMAPLSAYQDG